MLPDVLAVAPAEVAAIVSAALAWAAEELASALDRPAVADQIHGVQKVPGSAIDAPFPLRLLRRQKPNSLSRKSPSQRLCRDTIQSRAKL